MSAYRRTICGVDEAGRGPLAGPVVVAAVVLDRANPIAGLADSKTLSADVREALYDAILASAVVSVVSVGPARIDAMNIRAATLWGMRQAVMGLCPEVDAALVDGRDVPPGLTMRCRALIKGDARSASIAAASIVAKVTRDRIMTRLARSEPQYGFDRHKGYPTQAHRDALEVYGPTRHHRMSFAPVRAAAAAARAEAAATMHAAPLAVPA